MQGCLIAHEAPPPDKLLILLHEIFCPSYDLKAGKKCTVRARLRAGGERLSKGLATPRLRTGCVVFACHRTRGPLWAEWTIPRMCARDGWGCGGGGLLRKALVEQAALPMRGKAHYITFV